MRHIVCFSGGKDSTALVLWAKDNLPKFMTVFCDTGWEVSITSAYIAEVDRQLGLNVITLRSQKYENGFVDLCVLKGRAPSPKARFCTEALKVRPMIDWLKTLDDEATVYQGIRADESESRSAMLPRQWSDDYDAWIERPLLYWRAEQCFAMMATHGIKPNPLYLMGAGRVGCFPCVMVNQRELKAYLQGPLGEELKQRLFDLEALVGRSFFEPTYIPERFCTGLDSSKSKCQCGHALHPDEPCMALADPMAIDHCYCGQSKPKLVKFPWAADVFKYIESVDEDQMPMFPARSCMSIYNLCE